MNHTVRRIIILLMIAVLCILLVYLGLFAWVCYAESHIEAAPATDVMIVLGAQVKPDGTPSVQLENRLETALAAYMQQPQKIICCGGQAGQEPEPEGQIMADWLIARGVPASDVLPEITSGDTKENIRNAIRLLGYTPERVLIVTSDYHVARALWIAQDKGLTAYGAGSPTYWKWRFKNHTKEALSWIKYLYMKVTGSV